MADTGKLAEALRNMPPESAEEMAAPEEEGLDLAISELYKSFESKDMNAFKENLRAVLLLSKE